VGNKRLIATIGLDDLIIVDTPDALLVAHKHKTEQVKNIVDILKQSGRKEHYAHRRVKRPWGNYTVLESGNGFKVKLVEVKPKHSLSLQYHDRRSEHWVVVEGRAQIIKDKTRCTLNVNESIYVPVGCVHRITNPLDKPLKIIEVQAGEYLEESDIVRLKDSFGR
jgi:mannose-6-phosphate isomerase-like protein (cupin superfamily)